jgi:hypothetical protein
MLTAYRAWLESELQLLGNASHHAYSFGQANMAQRAIARLDEELAGKTAIVLPRAEAEAALAALEAAPAEDTAPLAAALKAALATA